MKYILLIVIICSIGFEFAMAETMHAKRCDHFCGGSRLNPFGQSGTCNNCCKEKGFMIGGECGDFLTRHCRCNLNPPAFAGAQPGYPGYPSYPGYPQPGYPNPAG